MNRMARYWRAQPFCLTVLLAALMVRSLIPAGYMPAPGQGLFALELCTAEQYQMPTNRKTTDGTGSRNTEHRRPTDANSVVKPQRRGHALFGQSPLVDAGARAGAHQHANELTAQMAALSSPSDASSHASPLHSPSGVHLTAHGAALTPPDGAGSTAQMAPINLAGDAHSHSAPTNSPSEAHSHSAPTNSQGGEHSIAQVAAIISPEGAQSTAHMAAVSLPGGEHSHASAGGTHQHQHDGAKPAGHDAPCAFAATAVCATAPVVLAQLAGIEASSERASHVPQIHSSSILPRAQSARAPPSLS